MTDEPRPVDLVELRRLLDEIGIPADKGFGPTLDRHSVEALHKLRNALLDWLERLEAVAEAARYLDEFLENEHITYEIEGHAGIGTYTPAKEAVELERRGDRLHNALVQLKQASEPEEGDYPEEGPVPTAVQNAWNEASAEQTCRNDDWDRRYECRGPLGHEGAHDYWPKRHQAAHAGQAREPEVRSE